MHLCANTLETKASWKESNHRIKELTSTNNSWLLAVEFVFILPFTHTDELASNPPSVSTTRDILASNPSSVSTTRNILVSILSSVSTTRDIPASNQPLLSTPNDIPISYPPSVSTTSDKPGSADSAPYPTYTPKEEPVSDYTLIVAVMVVLTILVIAGTVSAIIIGSISLRKWVYIIYRCSMQAVGSMPIDSAHTHIN